jgi:hypothetical protein
MAGNHAVAVRAETYLPLQLSRLSTTIKPFDRPLQGVARVGSCRGDLRSPRIEPEAVDHHNFGASYALGGRGGRGIIHLAIVRRPVSTVCASLAGLLPRR